MSGVFVTGTGTGVGKTLIACALGAQLKAAGGDVAMLKPVLTGAEEGPVEALDTGLLLGAVGKPVTPANIELASPWRFAAPLSPDMAAAREGNDIDFRALIKFCRDAAADERVAVIEGIGGAFSPLSKEHTVADWIAALEMPAILVTGSYLGTLSHTLATLEALRFRGAVIAGIVVSESEAAPAGLEETVNSLQHFTGDIPIVAVPRLPDEPEAWQRAPDLTGFA